MARAIQVNITRATVVRFVAAVVVVWLWLRLWQWVLLLIAAVFLAVGLDPFVSWLEARRVRRSYGAPLVVLAIALLLSAFLYFAGAELVAQGRLLGSRLTDVQREITRQVPAGVLELLPGAGGGQESSPQTGTYVARFGRALMNGLLSIAVALVLTVYLLLDGRRTYDWLVAFFARDKRPRVRLTAVEARKAVIGYVRGNVLTSAIAAIATYIVLLVLKVPAAMLLALLAGLFNFIPVVGIFLSAFPAVLLALTVSSTAALAVAAFYVVYNAFENYYIAPKVYGNELRLSDLAVILAFAVGAELGGVVGALIALPIAAMYPTIENIWLADRLGPEVAQDHRRIEDSEPH
jgi:predicted PurR-regulated permease PerM